MTAAAIILAVFLLGTLWLLASAAELYCRAKERISVLETQLAAVERELAWVRKKGGAS